MKFKDETSRKLFFRYAVPCSETLAKRGVITQKYQRSLVRSVILNKKIPKNAENTFKVASSMCEKTAKKLGKKSIDKEVIRNYFLFGHDKAVDRRYKIFKDFDPMLCRIYSGKVLLSGSRALVQTIAGDKEYSTSLRVKKGDYVVVHRDFIVEKISKKLAKKLWDIKQIYFKSNNMIA
jgi:hydrogenase maturation factor